MAKLNDLEDVTIDNPRVGDVVKYTATGWVNGADATGTPPGGNACGGNDDFLRRNIDEEITGTFTWQGEDGESKVIVESPTETTQLTGGSIIFTDKDSGESGRIQITNADNDLILRSNNTLQFSDSSTTEPVSLAELVACCDGGGSGSGVSRIVAGTNVNISPVTGTGVVTVNATATPTVAAGAFQPIGHDFNVDEASSDKSEALSWVASTNVDGANKKTVTVTYDDMNSVHPDAVVSEIKGIAMPPGATGALLLFQTNVAHSAPQLADTGPTSNRSIHTAHRLVVGNAQFVNWNEGLSRNDYMSSAVKNIIYVNSLSSISTRIQQAGINKIDIIEFDDGANVTFQSKCAMQKAARGIVKVNMGRVVILPFKKTSDSVVYNLAQAFGAGGDGDPIDSQGQEDNILSDLEADSPPDTPAESAVNLGRDLREYMRRAISSLDSRKLHPPVGSSKTTSDYEEQIGLLWGILDSDVLMTYDATVAALQPIIDEISTPEYGVSDLFEYEIQAGATTRSIF